MMENGLLLKGIGGLYSVKLENGEILEAKARGVFRSKNLIPLVGDRVAVSRTEDGNGIITEIFPRKNQLRRPPISNLDQLFFIVSTCEPKPNLLVLDKFIAIAEYKKIEPIIVITKVDIELGEKLNQIYQKAGFCTFMLSNLEKDAAAPIRKLLQGKISAFTGNSGVGKSTLLNNILPGLSQQTGNISQKLGRGKHTTRSVELFPLDEGGYVADTPGFSAMETQRYEVILKDELESCFREFHPYLGHCRFTGCSHVNDKGCAVLDALHDGKIAQSRHESYGMMYEEAKKIKEWEHEK